MRQRMRLTFNMFKSTERPLAFTLNSLTHQMIGQENVKVLITAHLARCVSTMDGVTYIWPLFHALDHVVSHRWLTTVGRKRKIEHLQQP